MHIRELLDVFTFPIAQTDVDAGDAHPQPRTDIALLLATTRKFVLSLVIVGLQTSLSFQLAHLVKSYTSSLDYIMQCYFICWSNIWNLHP
jgi:hypothetical protein